MTCRASIRTTSAFASRENDNRTTTTTTYTAYALPFVCCTVLLTHVSSTGLIGRLLSRWNAVFYFNALLNYHIASEIVFAECSLPFSPP